MNLVFNGCSFVKGNALRTHHDTGGHENLSWEEKEPFNFTTLLSNKLNGKQINIASAGGSNDRIIRSTYEWIKQNPNEVKDSIFVIGLTEILRSEKFCANTKTYVKWRYTTFANNARNFKKEALMLLDTKFYEFVKKNYLEEKVLEYGKMDLLLFSDFENEYKKLNQQLDMLQGYIDNLGGKLLVFAAMLELENTYYNRNEDFATEGASLDTSNFNFLTFPEQGSNCWRSYIKSYNANYHAYDHPAIDDQPVLVDILLNYINKNFK